MNTNSNKASKLEARLEMEVEGATPQGLVDYLREQEGFQCMLARKTRWEDWFGGRHADCQYHDVLFTVNIDRSLRVMRYAHMTAQIRYPEIGRKDAQKVIDILSKYDLITKS